MDLDFSKAQFFLVLCSTITHERLSIGWEYFRCIWLHMLECVGKTFKVCSRKLLGNCLQMRTYIV